MNGSQRMRAALSGQRPSAPPILLHNFMHAAAEAGISMARFRQDPHAVARAFISAVDRYGYDAILVDIDTATLAQALGVPVLLPDDEPALCHGARLQSLGQVPSLEPPDLARHPRVQVWLEAVRLLKAHYRGAIFIRGNCDQAPFALASQLRGAEAWMLDLMDPASEAPAHQLLDFCSSVSIQFLELMAAAGADMLSSGDSAAGPSLISPRLYRAFAQPYETRLALAARRLDLPYALHVCGKTEPILPELAQTGATALELDSLTDPARARDALAPHSIAFIGNLNPTFLALASPAEIEAQTRSLLHTFAGGERRFVLNAGCAIAPNTPSANLHAMIRAARQGYKE